jgi:uncharacterized protein (DUF697 family)
MDEKLITPDSIVKKYMYWSMGAGFIPVPFLDFAAVMAVQLKMLSTLAKHYGVSFSENRGKEIVAALIGAALPGNIAGSALGSALKMIPVAGTIIGGVSVPLLAGATTFAVGKVFTQHFETGGTFLDFDVEKMKSHFQQEFEKGKSEAANVASAASAAPPVEAAAGSPTKA